MTIDDLAVMVKHGFDEVHTRLDQCATKEDLKQFATKEDIHFLEQKLEQKMDAGFFAVNSRIDSLREDISDLPDIREAVQDVQNMDERLVRVERKLGFAQ